MARCLRRPHRPALGAVFRRRGSTFAAALFGAWHAGKTVYLCGDNLPATVARLRREVDGFAGDGFSDDDAVVAASDMPCAHEAGRRWTKTPRAWSFYTSGSTGDATAIDKRLSQLDARGRGPGGHVRRRAGRWRSCTARCRTSTSTACCSACCGRWHRDARSRRECSSTKRSSPRSIGPRCWSAVRPISSACPIRWIGRMRGRTCVRCSVPAARCRRTPRPRSAGCSASAPTEIYGSSETGGIAWRQWHDDAPVWRALPGVDWRIVDDHLEISSPHLPTRQWWRSEDRAESDGRNGFRLNGRADRIVKIEERARVAGRAGASTRSVAGSRRSTRAGAAGDAHATGGRRRSQRRRRGAARRRRPTHFRPRAARRTRLGTGCRRASAPLALRRCVADERAGQGHARPICAPCSAPSDRSRSGCRREEAKADLEIVLDPELAVFDGHFPQIAILPGVAQLDWAVRWGREAFAMPPRFIRMENLKFQRVLRPGTRVRLHLEWQQAKSAAGLPLPVRARRARQRPRDLRRGGGMSAVAPGFRPLVVIPVYDHEHAIGAMVDGVLAAGHAVPAGRRRLARVDCAAVLASAGSARGRAPAAPGAQPRQGRRDAGRFPRGSTPWRAATCCRSMPTASTTPPTSRASCSAAQAAPDAVINGCAGLRRQRAQGPAVRPLPHPRLGVDQHAVVRDPRFDVRLPRLSARAGAGADRRGDRRPAHGLRPRDPRAPALARRRRRATWPRRVRYPSDGVSHFDVWRDNVRITRMHTRLFFGMLRRLPRLAWRALR